MCLCVCVCVCVCVRARACVCVYCFISLLMFMGFFLVASLDYLNCLFCCTNSSSCHLFLFDVFCLFDCFLLFAVVSGFLCCFLLGIYFFLGGGGGRGLFSVFC